MIETTHARTLEASTKCKAGPGSCHDCAMTCPDGNTVKDPITRQILPCGSDVFDADGRIILCGKCTVACAIANGDMNADGTA